MADTPRLAYAQARLQARRGALPGPEDWRLAEASADLAHYLEALRRTGLAPWVAGLGADLAPEAMERELRAAWSACVDEAATWAPEDWRPALAWLRWLPYLPALDHLNGPRNVPPWMRADPVLRPIALDDPARRRQALDGLEIPLPDTEGDPGPSAGAAWLAAWRQRRPARAGTDAEAAEALARLVAGHVEAMRTAEGTGQPLRAALRDRLERLFRRASGSIGAVFAYLGLVGLDLERARAGVMARRLMPARPEGRSWA